jgi:hypothetical protein
MTDPRINKIAKHAAEMILLSSFSEKNKFPIKDWSYELCDENIEAIKRIEDHELAKEVLGNLDLMQGLIEEAMRRRLDYLMTEGFTYKKKGYYVFYTQKEIESQVRHILNDAKDSI